MAAICVCLALVLILLAGGTTARATDASSESGLYDRPVLVIDPGMHTAPIIRADADAEGRWAVTGSDDKTVRVWSLADGALLRTIRLPAGPGYVGKVYAVAVSPDGALIAAGGWTRWTEADPQQQIYLFDRDSGALVRRIGGLPDVVLHLAFSPDGRRLAAVLGGGGGLRIYAREQNWAEVARDVEYGHHSYGAAFAPDGRLATSAYDGKVRLYSGDLEGDVQPIATFQPPSGRFPLTGGRTPFSNIAFNPDGTLIAVTSAVIDVLDGHTLAPLLRPDHTGIYFVRDVAWSRDGRTLFVASGKGGNKAVSAWNDAGAGALRTLWHDAETNFLPVRMSLIPLPKDDLLVATTDPLVTQLGADGSPRWLHGPPQARFLGQGFDKLLVSSDGTRIEFGFAPSGKEPARFDLARLALTLDPIADGRTIAPHRHILPGINSGPNQRQLLDKNETLHSTAVHPADDRFVTGGEWSLRAFDAKGTPLWTRAAPGVVWAVNITGDGRLVVAAYGDGTIRWHRMSDGAELLAFMPLANRRDWAAWTLDGYFDATEDAKKFLLWHVNRGWDRPADSKPVESIPGYQKPELLPLVLQELETPRALGLLALSEQRERARLALDNPTPPGPQLHLLAIGIGNYNKRADTRLHLQFADKDADAFAAKIGATQGRLYTLKPQILTNQDAGKKAIITALDSMQKGMAKGNGNDLAVVFFSGHGTMIGNKLYLLPYEVDVSEPSSIKASALSIDEFRDELLALAAHGRVLVLLDACHAGAATMDGMPLSMNSTALRTILAMANITVITSSDGTEVSREDPVWGHGAFTKVLLQAFTDPEADINHNHLLNADGLDNYLRQYVPRLNDQQHPRGEVRFNDTVFAAGG